MFRGNEAVNALKSIPKNDPSRSRGLQMVVDWINGKGEPAVDDGDRQGVGVTRAKDAIDCLKRIPKKDSLKSRGFEIVTDWISRNG